MELSNIIEENNSVLKKFRRKNTLIRMKYLEYVPILVISNLSTFLLVTVDGLVVGNFMGSMALAAVNMFNPLAVLLSAYIAIIAHGIADSFADAMVENDTKRIHHNRQAIKFVIVASVIILSIVQVPIVHFAIHSYNLSPDMYEMAKTYAVVMLLSTPFGLISSVGACQFEEIGKMKVLLKVSIVESIINLTLDLLLVGVFKLGVFGAGMATSIASFVRALLTAIYFLTKTELYKSCSEKLRLCDIKEVVVGGLPYSVGILTSAVCGYLMLRLELYMYGESGGIVNGVCFFCLNVATVFITSTADANGPLNGIFLSMGDRIATRNALKIAARQIIVSVGLLTLLIELKPEWFYLINGVKDIPEFGIMALRISALYFVFYGLNALFDGYFIDRDSAKFTSRLVLIGDMLTPVVAFLFAKYIAVIYLWAADLVVRMIIFLAYLTKQLSIVIEERREEREEKPIRDILYLEVEQSEAEEAAEGLLQYAEEKNYSKEISINVANCIKEMVDYAVKAQDNIGIHIQLVISFFKNGATFIMLDDGECLHLKKTNNYDTDKFLSLKKSAKSYKYQYILNMNYTKFEF